MNLSLPVEAAEVFCGCIIRFQYEIIILIAPAFVGADMLAQTIASVLGTYCWGPLASGVEIYFILLEVSDAVHAG